MKSAKLTEINKLAYLVLALLTALLLGSVLGFIGGYYDGKASVLDKEPIAFLKDYANRQASAAFQGNLLCVAAAHEGGRDSQLYSDVLLPYTKRLLDQPPK